tara:strand:+ start:905 stop:1489 length:585 start_codon:yes stop_codon:yes gene_type:complete
MAQISERQPTKLDYSSPTQFKFNIHQLPLVEFNSVGCNLPGINMGDAIFPTPFKQIPVMGDTITFENLTLQFIVDEYLENYITAHNWMTAIGFPKNRKQFADFRSVTSNTPQEKLGVSRDIGDTQPSTPANALFSDATLTILSNKNNPIVNVLFRDIYPVSLSPLDFTQTATDVEYQTAVIDFSYQLYEFETLS